MLPGLVAAMVVQQETLTYYTSCHTDILIVHRGRVPNQTVLATRPEFRLFEESMSVLRHLLDLRERKVFLGKQVVHRFGVLGRDVVNLRQIFLLQ